ncbi:MAG: SH3 domain-containing protein [Nitrospirota bacterium]|jgi:hypothetical protein
MALKKCKECGHEISSKAKRCPNCGAPLKKGIGCGTAFLIIILAAIFIPYLIAKNYEYPETETTNVGSTYKSTGESKPTRGKRYAHQTINIRSGRGTDFKVVGSLRRGEKVEVADSENGWIAVYKNGDKKGFVYEKLLKSYPLPSFEIENWNWYKDPSFGTRGAVIWTVEVRNNTNNYVELLKIEFTTYDAKGNIITSDFAYVEGLSPGGTASTKSYATYFGKEEKAKIRIVP